MGLSLVLYVEYGLAGFTGFEVTTWSETGLGGHISILWLFGCDVSFMIGC